MPASDSIGRRPSGVRPRRPASRASRRHNFDAAARERTMNAALGIPRLVPSRDVVDPSQRHVHCSPPCRANRLRHRHRAAAVGSRQSRADDPTTRSSRTSRIGSRSISSASSRSASRPGRAATTEVAAAARPRVQAHLRPTERGHRRTERAARAVAPRGHPPRAPTARRGRARAASARAPASRASRRAARRRSARRAGGPSRAGSRA